MVIDLSASNVVFTTSFLRGSLKEDAFEVLGEPETAELVRRDGAPLRENLPKRLVEKACWTGWCHEDEEDLRFVDVAQMFPLSSPPSYLPQPCDLRAPETILDTVFDHRNDLWRLGCIVRYSSTQIRCKTLTKTKRRSSYWSSTATLSQAGVMMPTLYKI